MLQNYPYVWRLSIFDKFKYFSKGNVNFWIFNLLDSKPHLLGSLWKTLCFDNFGKDDDSTLENKITV